VAVLSDGLWRRDYGGEPSAIGRSISLDGHPFQIVGVADPRFTGVDVGERVQVFAPICAEEILEPGHAVLDMRSRWFLRIIGRPLAGLSAGQAGARLASIAAPVFATTVPQNWDPQDQQDYQKNTLAVRPAPNGLSYLREQYRGALLILMAVVGVVLLIACGNVANLLLARAAGRQHEMAVRRAIGSGRGRLIRQLVTESLLLSGLGAALGVGFAKWASRLVVGLLASSGDAVFLDLSLDWRVLGFTVAVATVTGLVFGLAPAWRATRIAPQAAMRAAGRNVADGRARFAAGKGLVIGQLALSLALVMAAGLLIGSLVRLLWIDPGFRREGVLLVRANLSNAYQQDVIRSTEHDLLRRLRSLPGVRTASSSMVTPIGHSRWNSIVHVDGYTPPKRDDALVYMNTVSDGYFATLGTTFLAGRDFDARDVQGSAPVAIIDETMARRFFNDPRPLGKQFSVDQPGGQSPSYQVVGVVQDAKYTRLNETPQALAYYPHSQGEVWGGGINYELRTDGSPAALVPAVKALLAQANPAIALDFQTLSEQVSQSLARPRLLAVLSGFFGGMALLLAMIGLYGTVSYSVASRRSEIGVRLALGAAPARVLKMVLGEIGWLVGPGLVLGLVAALAGARVLGTFLFGVTASDPPTLTISAVALSAAAFAAGAIPAWRAARLDPVATLREE
jgi:putative ABC transport system permease protein